MATNISHIHKIIKSTERTINSLRFPIGLRKVRYTIKQIDRLQVPKSKQQMYNICMYQYKGNKLINVDYPTIRL